MGVHVLGVMNDNGERFVNACAANNIVIGESVCSPTREYTRQLGYHLTKSLNTRSTISTSTKHSEDRYKT